MALASCGGITAHTRPVSVRQRVGSGVLQVVYDEDVFCVRVMMMNDETEEPLCDVLVTMQHKYLVSEIARLQSQMHVRLS